MLHLVSGYPRPALFAGILAPSCPPASFKTWSSQGGKGAVRANTAAGLRIPGPLPHWG